MAPKINEEIRQALQQQPGKPLEVEDDQTHLKYVVIPAETFQKVQALFYDDGEFDPDDFMPLVHEALSEDLDAPGMELYDDYEAHRPKS